MFEAILAGFERKESEMEKVAQKGKGQGQRQVLVMLSKKPSGHLFAMPDWKEASVEVSLQQGPC